MSNYQKVTKSVVKAVAEKLIDENGETTTLDVKQSLRSSGYFAVQQHVSDLMFEIGTEESWNVNNNGVHRIYSIQNSDPNTGNQFGKTNYANVQNQPNFQNPNIQSYTKRRGPTSGTVIYSKSVRDTGDWKVSSTQSNSPVMYFSSKYTRDDVRLAYSQINRIPIQQSLATKK